MSRLKIGSEVIRTKKKTLFKYFLFQPEPHPKAAIRQLEEPGTPHLPPIKTKKFTEDYNELINTLTSDLIKINTSIDAYNDCEEIPIKIEILETLHLQYQSILKKYPHCFVTICPTFISKIQENLFEQIITETKRLALEAEKLSIPSAPRPPIVSLENIVSTMPTHKIKQLLLRLLTPGSLYKKLTSLYVAGESGYEDFMIFLSTLKDCKVLSHNNSINYLLTFVENASPPLILKVHNRLGNSAFAEKILREIPAFKHILIPILAERQATILVKGKAVTRTIIVNPFCEGLDLKRVATALGHSENKQQTLDLARLFFLQIGNFFEQCRCNKIGLSDAKLSNYLVQRNNTVRVADTKSLVCLKEDGSFVQDDHYFRDMLIYTPFMQPPELKEKKCDAEQAHAYFFGKNLYQFLTHCSNVYLQENHDGQDYDFSHPLFATPEGCVYQYLITELIQPESNKRMYVHDAVLALRDMNLVLTQKRVAARTLIRKYYEYSYTLKTHDWQTVVAQYNRAVDTANIDSIKLYLQDLQDKVQTLAKEHCLKLLSQILALTPTPLSQENSQTIIEEAAFDEIPLMEQELTTFLSGHIAEQQQLFLKKRQSACEDLLREVNIALLKTQALNTTSLLRYYQQKISGATEKNIEKITNKLKETRAYYCGIQASKENNQDFVKIEKPLYPKACFFKYTKTQRQFLKSKPEEKFAGYYKLPTIMEGEENARVTS